MGLLDKIADRVAEKIVASDGSSSPSPARRSTLRPCPRCGAKADQRVESCGFGPVKSILCGACGYTFTAEEL